MTFRNIKWKKGLVFKRDCYWNTKKNIVTAVLMNGKCNAQTLRDDKKSSNGQESDHLQDDDV